jgi:Fe-S oxidoreductase
MLISDHPHDSSAIQAIAERCNRCTLCQKDCSFLQKYGLPADIAEKYLEFPEYVQDISFSCSLCGLCAAVCPVALFPDMMFLDLRREAVASGKKNLIDHRRLLAFERRGVSPRYTWYSLPKNCTTVFFPGCSLPGGRPGKTLKIYKYLLGLDATTGIVLDCCGKPSHDLGRQGQFERMFFELKEYLLSVGVTTVLVACPSCHKVFSQYGDELKVETIYERIAACGMDGESLPGSEVILHDPCAVRFVPEIHAAVREIARMQGLNIVEMSHSRNLTFCCGEGGDVDAVERKLARKWSKRNAEESKGRMILTYCTGCTGFLHRYADISHVLDLIFEPQRVLDGKAVFARAPFTYFNRLELKRRLRKEHPAAQWRERPSLVSTKMTLHPRFSVFPMLLLLPLLLTISWLLVSYMVAG